MGRWGTDRPGKGPAPPDPLRHLRLQTSGFGDPVPIVYGENRVAGNIILTHGFHSQVPKDAGVGHVSGKMGGRNVSVSYVYFVDIIICLGEGQTFGTVPQTLDMGLARPGAQVMNTNLTSGQQVKPQPVTGIAVGCWKLKRALAAGGTTPKRRFPPARWLAFASGHFVTNENDLILDAVTKPKFHDYLLTLATTNYPGFACVVQQNMHLGGNASVPTWNFPFRGLMQYADIYGEPPGGGVRDAEPSTIQLDLLISPQHGAGWDTLIGLDVFPPGAWRTEDNSWGAFCRATDIFISPVYDQQATLATMLDRLALLTNTALVFSGGVLKMVPYALTARTSTLTGVTFTPSTDPLATGDGANASIRAHLTMDDFKTGSGRAPIEVQRKNFVADHDSNGYYNLLRVEFLNRLNAYNTETIEVKDEAGIAQFGEIAGPTMTVHEITSAELAHDTAQRVLQRLVGVRSIYRFTLGWEHVLLEPMDLVTLTDPALRLLEFPVRIMSIAEDEAGRLAVEAEESADLPSRGLVAEPPPGEEPTLVPGVFGGADTGDWGSGWIWFSVNGIGSSYNAYSSGASPLDVGVPITRPVTITSMWVRDGGAQGNQEVPNAYNRYRLVVNEVPSDVFDTTLSIYDAIDRVRTVTGTFDLVEGDLLSLEIISYNPDGTPQADPGQLGLTESWVFAKVTIGFAPT